MNCYKVREKNIIEADKVSVWTILYDSFEIILKGIGKIQDHTKLSCNLH